MNYKITDDILFTADLEEKNYKFTITRGDIILYTGTTVSLPNTTRCLVNVSSLIKDDFNVFYGLNKEGLNIRRIVLNNSDVELNTKPLGLNANNFELTTVSRARLINDYVITFESNDKTKVINFTVVYKSEGYPYLTNDTSSLGVNYVCNNMIIPYISEDKVIVSITDNDGVVTDYEDIEYLETGARITYLGYITDNTKNVKIGNLNLTPTSYIPEYIIYYQNTIGGIDWMFFNDSSVNNIEINRNTVKVNTDNYLYNADGTITVIKTDADDVIINNSYTKTINLKSVLITKGLYNRVINMIKSNKVWIASANNNYDIESCSIIDKDISTKNSRSDKLVQFNISVKLNKQNLL